LASLIGKRKKNWKRRREKISKIQHEIKRKQWGTRFAWGLQGVFTRRPGGKWESRSAKPSKPE